MCVSLGGGGHESLPSEARVTGDDRGTIQQRDGRVLRMARCPIEMVFHLRRCNLRGVFERRARSLARLRAIAEHSLKCRWGINWEPMQGRRGFLQRLAMGTLVAPVGASGLIEPTVKLLQPAKIEPVETLPGTRGDGGFSGDS